MTIAEAVTKLNEILQYHDTANRDHPSRPVTLNALEYAECLEAVRALLPLRFVDPAALRALVQP